MNDVNDKNEDVTPYRASGNLNTYIGIPKINVNDPMNVNIQNVNTNSNMNTIPLDDISNNIENTNDNGIIDEKTKVSKNNNKKKRVAIKLGPKFKIIFLIAFILLVFIFLLPIIVSLFNK